MNCMKLGILLIALSFLSFYLRAQQPVKLATSSDTLQYSLGAFVGEWMAKNGFKVDNPILFKKGMDDVLQRKALLVADSTIGKRIIAYQQTTRIEMAKQMEEALFSALKNKPGVGVLPSGVNYFIIRTGEGIRPLPKDTVVLNAIGTLPDGTVFENTIQKKQTITTVIGELIPGLNEAIQLMQEGSSWRIFIPSAQGFGAKGLQDIITPNSALVYDIELVKVKSGKK